MSAPQALRVSKGVEVWMGKTACREIYDYLEPLLPDVYGEDSDVAGWFIASTVSARRTSRRIPQ